MSFDQILDRASRSADTRDNPIGDGQLTCRYGDAPALLSQIEAFLAARGIGPETCVAVECPNSLPGALLLMSLLRMGSGFAMAPPPAAANSDLKPIPRFCQHRLTVLPATPAAAPFAPAGFLRIETNPHYNGRAVSRARVYLRTSGSMGASKIVVHSHEKLIGNARGVVRKYGFAAASRAMIPVPIAHMYGFGAEFLPALLTGASIDLQEKTNLLKYLDREKRFQPTIAFVTPSICEMLLKGYKAPRASYRAFVTSGQRIGEELFRAFDPLVGGTLMNQYGSTEMGATAACDPGATLDDRATTIGTPMDGVELRIENASGHASGGALLCRHPYGFEGYLDEEGEWAHRETPDGWYRTGDLAAELPGGSCLKARIAVLGRADASVNRSGYLVLLSDIERIMERLEALGEVAVVAGRGETRHGPRIAAFCVLRPGCAVDGAQLRQRCFDVLPHYAIPDDVRVMESLPMLPSGKVDRQALTGLAGSPGFENSRSSTA